MKTKSSARGFTLIELLVVISIIGLMSSIVLAALQSARAKAADASIESNMNSVQSAAELYYNSVSPSSYGSAFTVKNFDQSFACPNQGVFSDASVKRAISLALATAGPTASPECVIGPNGWGVAVPLKTGGRFCVVSDGGGSVIAANRHLHRVDTIPVSASYIDCKSATVANESDNGGGL